MGGGPVYAAVGDALAVYEIAEGLAGDEFLRACHQVALDHDAEDVAVACSDLFGDLMADDGLALVVLAAVSVAAVDHDARVEAGGEHAAADFVDAGGVVVGGVGAAAKDDVRVAVAGGAEDGRLAVFGVAEKGMRLTRREDGFDGDAGVAGGAVLETDRA